ncbi:hypothetical protein MNEG_3465, partial [Monoraphidium neglectum]
DGDGSTSNDGDGGGGVGGDGAIDGGGGGGGGTCPALGVTHSRGPPCTTSSPATQQRQLPGGWCTRYPCLPSFCTRLLPARLVFAATFIVSKV